ncbi:MAG: hypothetical protein CML29_05005 [Rhizobiales bacterium]|nr:hypothetical protein [Hyphomicrobiales bacterium]MBA71013.1 hypothetical protein [Hyphomicrobiales bacterium]
MRSKISVVQHLEASEKRAGKPRARVSSNALDVALKSALEAGLTVDKLCVIGSRIEIHVRQNAPAKAEPGESGLEDW